MEFWHARRSMRIRGAACAGPAVGEGLLGGRHARTPIAGPKPSWRRLARIARRGPQNVFAQHQHREAVNRCIQIGEEPEKRKSDAARAAAGHDLREERVDADYARSGTRRVEIDVAVKPGPTVRLTIETESRRVVGFYHTRRVLQLLVRPFELAPAPRCTCFEPSRIPRRRPC